MRREIPLCVLEPLRRIRGVHYRMAQLIGSHQQNVGLWLRRGWVPESHWQDFMAQAIALLEVKDTLRPMRRRAIEREYHRRWIRAYRQSAPEKYLKWLHSYNGQRRERRRWRGLQGLYEALRCEGL